MIVYFIIFWYLYIMTPPFLYIEQELLKIITVKDKDPRIKRFKIIFYTKSPQKIEVLVGYLEFWTNFV